MRMPLTSGIIMPMDLSASVVQSAQRNWAVDQIDETPTAASRPATAAAWGGDRTATRRGAWGCTSATGRVDITDPSLAHSRCEAGWSYLEELRRARMRARAETKKAPAEPTTARRA